MKITCNSLLEAPLINLLMLFDSLNTKGVCGILTPNSKHTVEHTTLSSLAMLSYCNELIVTDALNEQLRIVDIQIPKGPITYQGVADASGGYLTVPHDLRPEPFAMATDTVTFKLLIGSSTVSAPLREEDVFTYIAERKQDGFEFTDIPMPLLSKRLLKFEAKSTNGVSHIECESLQPSIVDELIASIKVE